MMEVVVRNDHPAGGSEAEDAWVRPARDRFLLAEDADRAEVVERRESVRLAFVAAPQRLPPRQRAVLILREVLGWRGPRWRGSSGRRRPRSTAGPRERRPPPR